MAKVFNVSYDLRRPGQDYSKLYEELKKPPTWWHYLDSTWLISTTETASHLWKRIEPHVDRNDSVLITEVGKDLAGCLPQDAWNWINEQVRHSRAA